MGPRGLTALDRKVLVLTLALFPIGSSLVVAAFSSPEIALDSLLSFWVVGMMVALVHALAFVRREAGSGPLRPLVVGLFGSAVVAGLGAVVFEVFAPKTVSAFVDTSVVVPGPLAIGGTCGLLTALLVTLAYLAHRRRDTEAAALPEPDAPRD